LHSVAHLRRHKYRGANGSAPCRCTGLVTYVVESRVVAVTPQCASHAKVGESDLPILPYEDVCRLSMPHNASIKKRAWLHRQAAHCSAYSP